MSERKVSFSEISLDLEDVQQISLPRLRMEHKQSQPKQADEDLYESLTNVSHSSDQTKVKSKTFACYLKKNLWIVLGLFLIMILIAGNITFGVIAFKYRKSHDLHVQEAEKVVEWQFWTPEYRGGSQRLVLTTEMKSEKNATAIKQHLQSRSLDTGKPLSEMTALIITDACTLFGGTLPEWVDFREFLHKDVGISTENINVVTIYESPNAVELLNEADLIVFTGGNVFKLRYALFQKEGVVDAIRNAVHSGVVYASQSAGSVIAGESIGWTYQKNADGKGKIDNPPNDWPDFDDPENWTALALVDKSIFVHFKEEDHKKVMDVGKLQPIGNTFILPDPQTLFVHDGFMKILQ